MQIFFGWLQYTEGVFGQPVVTTMSICPSIACVDRQKLSSIQKIITTPESLLLPLDQHKATFVRRSFRRQISGERHPGKTRFIKYIFNLSIYMLPASGKIPIQLTQNSTMILLFCFFFSRKVAFERQTSCGIISGPVFWCKIVGIGLFFWSIAGFSYPSNAKIWTFRQTVFTDVVFNGGAWRTLHLTNFIVFSWRR